VVAAKPLVPFAALPKKGSGGVARMPVPIALCIAAYRQQHVLCPGRLTGA
jgi:hypothetical protein